MSHPRNYSDSLWLVLKGLAMGAANKVPGVSGGVVAFVAGFYEEFIYSLQKINTIAFKLLINGRFKSFYQYINGKFLGLLILGMLVSYFSVSQLLDYWITHYELYVWSAFFGMIIGSIYYICKDFNQWNRRNIVLIICGVIAGIGISFLSPAKENDNLIFVFFCGIIGVSGMTMPGLSGSFILILLGNYVLLLVDSVNALYDTIANIISLDFEFTSDPKRMRLLAVLSSFALGSLTGLVTLSHLLGYVLKRYHHATYAVIIGFITGSLGVVWPWKKKIFELDTAGNILLDANGDQIISNYTRYWPSEFSFQTGTAIFYILIGIIIILALAWFGNRNKK
jgi:uncharacterized membrane protein